MMTILLKRQEYFRATHLPRQTSSLAMAVGIEIVSESRRQFTSVDSSIVKGPIRLRGSHGQNLAAGTRFCERLYQAQFKRANIVREFGSDANIRPNRRLRQEVRISQI